MLLDSATANTVFRTAFESSSGANNENGQNAKEKSQELYKQTVDGKSMRVRNQKLRERGSSLNLP